jgi:hypothetical protein
VSLRDGADALKVDRFSVEIVDAKGKEARTAKSRR